MRFIENAAFDEANQRNLILDFYDFYYYIDQIEPKINLGPAYEETIEFWKEDIIKALKVLDASLKGTVPQDEALNVLDYAATLYGKLNSFYGDSQEFQGKEYDLYILTMEETMMMEFNHPLYN